MLISGAMHSQHRVQSANCGSGITCTAAASTTLRTSLSQTGQMASTPSSTQSLCAPKLQHGMCRKLHTGVDRIRHSQPRHHQGEHTPGKRAELPIGHCVEVAWIESLVSRTVGTPKIDTETTQKHQTNASVTRVSNAPLNKMALGPKWPRFVEVGSIK